MSKDYKGVSGFGVKLQVFDISRIIGREVSLGEVSVDDLVRAISDERVSVKEAGDLWSGPGDYYLVVPGLTLSEVYFNAPQYAEAMEELGFDVDIDELRLVSDYVIT